MIFNSFSGYTSELAQSEFREFLKKIPGPKGVHLCGNPDWSFLLGADIDILSVDAYSWGHILIRYVDEVKEFLTRGKIIAFGITPTLTSELALENEESLTRRLFGFWEFLGRRGVDEGQVYDRCWLTPSRCCLINTDDTKSVDRSFELLRKVARAVRAI